MPSPSQRRRDGESSTKPSLWVAVGLVEAARFWGGQLFVLSRTKLRHNLDLESQIIISEAAAMAIGFEPMVEVDLIQVGRDDFFAKFVRFDAKKRYA